MSNTTQGKTKGFWTAAIVLLVGVVPALGATSEDPASSGTPRFEIGPELYRYTYEEPGLMELDGMLFGLRARFDYEGPIQQKTGSENRWLFRADARLATGEHDYDGQLQDGTPYTMSGIDADSLELQLLAGYQWAKKDYVTNLFMGFGRRTKDDDSSSDPAGYKRESLYNYLPIAVEHVRFLSQDREVAFAVEYDLFLSGEQTSHLGGTAIVNDQDSGSGIRASAGYTAPWKNHMWTLEVFVRSWDIDKSKVTRYWWFSFVEPKNETMEMGVSGRIHF